MKRRRARAEFVTRHARRIGDCDAQAGPGVRRPHAAVLRAERAVAGARRDDARIGGPVQLEGDVAAMALAGDQHLLIP